MEQDNFILIHLHIFNHQLLCNHSIACLNPVARCAVICYINLTFLAQKK